MMKNQDGSFMISSSLRRSLKVEFSEQEIHQMIGACTKEQLPIVKSIFEVVETYEELKTTRRLYK